MTPPTPPPDWKPIEQGIATPSDGLIRSYEWDETYDEVRVVEGPIVVHDPPEAPA